MKLKLGSTRAALLIITYNCLVVPVIAFVLVFVWRVSIGSIYGYAKYDPINFVLFWLLAAVIPEIIFVAKVAEVKNIRGILVGLGVSLLLSPVVLMAIWFSIMLGNR